MPATGDASRARAVVDGQAPAVPQLDGLLADVRAFPTADAAERAVRSALRDARLRGGPIDLDRGVDIPTVLARLLATVRHLEGRLQDAEDAALLDPLTGLANRRAWRRALRSEEERHRRGGEAAVVAVVDIDDFKSVNDRAGHAAGDALLVVVGQSLAHAARLGDVVARTGGDEFAVLATGTGDAGRIAERLREALDAAGVACSIGAAGRPPASSLGDAWDVADRAMYADKGRRRRR